MIYFARPMRGGPVKIGSTCQLKTRLKELCRIWKTNLEVLAIMDGGLAVEKGLHRKFEHLALGNEWFLPGEDLFRFIAEEGRPWDGDDLVGKGRRTTSICFEKDVYEAVQALAASQGRSYSSVINSLMREHYGLPPERTHKNRRTLP